MCNKEIHLLIAVTFTMLSNKENSINFRMFYRYLSILGMTIIYNLSERHLLQKYRFFRKFSFAVRYVFIIIFISMITNLILNLDENISLWMVKLQFVFLSIIGYFMVFYHNYKGLMDTVFIFIYIPLAIFQTNLVLYGMDTYSHVFEFGPVNYIYCVT